MKAEIETSDGKRWPLRLTLGALRRFKAETGREVSDAKGASDMAVLIWCCVKSTCNADGIEMDMDEETFLDKIETDAIESLSALMAEEKKRVKVQEKP